MPTTNPVPSTDPSDLLFNAGKLDEVVNGAGSTYTDRLGVTRRTLGGIDAEAEALIDAIDAAAVAQRDNIQDSADLVLASAGYAPPVAYAAGIIMTLQTQTVSYNGDAYAPKQSELPFTTSGTFETAKFRLIQGVASADLPALAGQDLYDYAALRAYTGNAKRVYITGLLVTVKPAGIFGVFQHDPNDTTSTDNGGTIIVGADGRRWKRDYIGAPDPAHFGAKGDGSDDSPAFQTAVDVAIATGINRIFVRFAANIRYRFASTVVILAGDFAITGDHKPIRGAATSSYIYGDAGVDALFDFGGSQNHAHVGAFVVDGIATYGKANVDANDYTKQPRAIKTTQTNNGPTRHMLFRNFTANNFYDAVFLDNPGVGTLAAATVTFDACYTRNNARSAVYANKRLLGFRYVGNLSESGGQVKGAIHGGVSITDNMLEGSVNTIDISGTGPANLVLARNYFEANSGNFVCRFIPTNIGSSLTLEDNFFGGGAGLSNYDDFVYIGGGATLVENNTAATVDFALSTIESAWQGSKLRGKFFHPVDAGKSTTIWCDPNQHIGKKPSVAITVRVIGFDEIETPFGRTKNGIIQTGSSLGGVGPSQPAVYSQGDVIVAVALIKADEGSLPRMIVYDQSSVNLPADSGNMTTGGVAIQPNMGGEWQLWCYAFPAARAGTGLRFRFGAGVDGKSMQIASYGYQVIPAADFITTTYSSKTRAKCQLWTPFYFEPSEIDGSKTYDWPDIATATTQSTTVTVTGAAPGDFAESSMSVSLNGTRLWAEVTSADIVTVYQRNDTGANVNVASGTLRVRVRKA